MAVAVAVAVAVAAAADTLSAAGYLQQMQVKMIYCSIRLLHSQGSPDILDESVMIYTPARRQLVGCGLNVCVCVCVEVSARYRYTSIRTELGYDTFAAARCMPHALVARLLA